VPVPALGSIAAEPAAARPDLLGDPVRALIEARGWGERIGVFPIDPALSETGGTQATYGLDASTLVNCVVLAGRREGQERIAACLIPWTKRADVNPRRSAATSPPRRVGTGSVGPAWFGSGIRGSKLLVPGALVVEGLGRPVT
jgi:hypothetical protein